MAKKRIRVSGRTGLPRTAPLPAGVDEVRHVIRINKGGRQNRTKPVTLPRLSFMDKEDKQ